MCYIAESPIPSVSERLVTLIDDHLAYLPVQINAIIQSRLGMVGMVGMVVGVYLRRLAGRSVGRYIRRLVDVVFDGSKKVACLIPF